MKWILIATLLIASMSTLLLSSTTAPSNSIRATRVVHFDAGPQKRSEIIAEIASGSLPQPVEAAVAATLRVPMGMMRNLVRLNDNPATDDITVTVELPTPDDVQVAPFSRQQTKYPLLASEAADAATTALMESLTPPGQQDLKWSVEKRDELLAQRQTTTGALHDLESKLRNRSDSVDVSPETIHQLLSSLQTQRESLSLDLVAKQARADALAEQVAKFSDRLAKKVQGDPVAQELEKVVELQQKSADQLQAQCKAGVVPQAEADKAIVELAEARAKLLERKSLAASTAGGDTLAAWNRELMNLSVDQAELNARLKAINDRLNRLAEAGDMLDHTEQLRAQLADITKQVIDANAKFADLQFHAERDHVEFKILPEKSTNEPAPATQPSH